MDSIGKLIRTAQGRKGVAVVYIALILVVLIALVGLAIDIGYMYVTKGQLQNAADAAALAGAALIDSTGSSLQPAVRNEAVKFAAANQAAKISVTIDPNPNNDENGDVVVGYWDGTSFTPAISGKLINAVKITTRRTGETGTGMATSTQVGLFFARVIGWQTMAAKASAVAYAKSFWPAPLTLCTDACGKSGDFYLNNSKANSWQITAWTLFNPTASVDDKDLKAYIDGTKFITNDLCNCNPATCAVSTYGCGFTTSNSTSPINDLADKFNDPNFYREYKTFDSSRKVSSWKVMMPVVDARCNGGSGCPPSDQGMGGPASREPYHVWGWALVDLSGVNAKGSGNEKGFSATVSNVICEQCPNAIQKLNATYGPVTPVLVQ